MLTYVKMSDKTEIIGEGAFYNCINLETLEMGVNVKTIGKAAFYKCKALSSVTLPDTLKKIEREAFYNCASLESIVIPTSVKSIGQHAFYCCDDLTSASIGSSVEEIGASAKIDKRTRSALEKLLVTSAAKKDCTLSRDTAGYMITLVGEDMSTLQNELNKVCAFAGSGEITRKHIDEIVIVSVEAKIFNLSRMITKGEADQAFETLSNLFKLREEPVMILGVLSKAFVDMYRVKAAKEKGVSYTALADAFPSTYKGRNFILDNAARDGANYSVTQLKNALSILSDTDRRLKSTNEDGRIVLEELILRLLRV
jgi:DNA polymerase III delta subunit